MALVHQTLVKRKPEFFIFFLIYLKKPFFPVCLADQDFQIFRFTGVLVIEYILDLLIVDRDQHIPGFDLKFFRNTPGFYFYDRMFTQNLAYHINRSEVTLPYTS